MDTTAMSWEAYNPIELKCRSIVRDTNELVWDSTKRIWREIVLHTKELVWDSDVWKWKIVFRNSAEGYSAELYWKTIEENSDEWKAAEFEWNAIELKKQNDRLFEKGINLLADEWISWFFSPDRTEDNRVLENYRWMQTKSEVDFQIRIQFEYLRVRCGYDKDSYFLNFLKMLMPCATSSPIKMLNSDVIRYRETEKQCLEYRKKHRCRLVCLCKKTTEIPPEVVLLISQFIPSLLVLPSAMYFDTLLVENKQFVFSNPIHWVSLRYHPIR